ncbi:hypothetical protein EDB80DRAFT_179851 [Ilyonectria destructans]|nr:hypothetical protein EDB80DRAFT_179851 [Ilyonectria destructans]
MLRRRARPVPDWIVDRPSPGGCSSGPSAWDSGKCVPRRLIPCPRSATPPCLSSPLSQIRGLSWDTVTLCWPRTMRLDAPLRSRPRTCGLWTLGTLEPQNLGSTRPLLGTCGTRSLTRKPVQRAAHSPVPMLHNGHPRLFRYSIWCCILRTCFIPSMARSTVFLHVEITARAGCGIQRHNYPLNSIRSLGLQNTRRLSAPPCPQSADCCLDSTWGKGNGRPGHQGDNTVKCVSQLTSLAMGQSSPASHARYLQGIGIQR